MDDWKLRTKAVVRLERSAKHYPITLVDHVSNVFIKTYAYS